MTAHSLPAAIDVGRLRADDDIAGGQSATEGPRGPTVRTTVALRWSDLDLLGHVNNARILTLLEEAGFAFHDALRRDHPASLPDTGRVVARWEVDYIRPVLRGADVEVTTTRLSLGRSSYRLGYVCEQDGRVAVEAVSVLVRVDADGQALPLSDAEVRLLNTEIR
ncbi:MAG: thioesterase family protein [Micrococcus sp.]|nr:thioesterase family protein [Micrococcus sp.]